ncbi:MAG: (4Fe-4S)-binding protein [Cyclobacteriaceae bacterium]|nr:(4Fe-4S)-binding protein [Cyclobacteriaceae bacterium]
MKDIVKKYTNGEVTVVWKPDLCVHSTICFKGLGEVFDPRKRPWVNPEGAATEKIVEQVKKCPSGALSHYLNRDAGDEKIEVQAETIVEPVKDGPLMVYGNVVIKTASGELERKHTATAFCRCGGSANKPFCDGTHRKIGFQS